MVTDLIERPDPRLAEFPMPETWPKKEEYCPAESGKWLCTLRRDHQPTLHQGWSVTDLCAVWEGDARDES